VLRSVKYGLYGAVLAGLAAAPVVWSSVDKSVDLVVDGRTTAVHTTAADVADVLRDNGYRVTPHDLVAPSLSLT
jgi:resuscitation-promoting factor RpfB